MRDYDSHYGYADSVNRRARLVQRVGELKQCLSDRLYHNTGLPQLGPGVNPELSTTLDIKGGADFGRENVTGDAADRFKFRTSPLRMVAMTAPYGHSGAYDTLESVVRHHLDPIHALHNYNASQVRLPARADLDAEDFVVQDDPARRQAIADRVIEPGS